MSAVVTILRIENAPGDGTFGAVLLDGCTFCVSLEPPWYGNQVDVSCIPPGQYHCAPVTSPRFGETYEVMDVPGRSEILFHAGNWARDTRGCIMFGEAWGEVDGQRGIRYSAATVATFKARQGRIDFRLTIKNVW